MQAISCSLCLCIGVEIEEAKIVFLSDWRLRLDLQQVKQVLQFKNGEALDDLHNIKGHSAL